MRTFTRISAALATFAAAATVLPAVPADNADLQALREQVQALEQQLKVLARQIEIKEEAATAAAPTTAKVTVNDKGFTVASADGTNFLRIRGLVQLDSRLFFGDGGGIANNSFLLRRARYITEGQFAKFYTFQFVPEFGGNTVNIMDANIGINFDKSFALKFGKFKSPVGLELLQSDAWTFFDERSLATNLVPNRDIGVQASGDVLNGTLNYTAGVFGGVPDGANSGNTDFDNEKDLVGRLFYSPFKSDADSFLQGLSFGISGSTGREKTASGRTAGYKTDGQQTFFAYSATTIADGQTWRIAPQLDYRNGPLGIVGEYVISTVNVRPSATGVKTQLENRAWQLSAGYVLTGEDSSFTGVSPSTNFDWKAGTWGALEVTGRYSNLKVDDAAFPLYASVTTNADEATAFGAGLNWYLSKAVAFKFDYFQTKFGFSALSPAISANQILRQDEKAFISRFQISF